MKIEKINNDKIKITITNIDLEKNNIDIHSFMANSIESQNIFLNMLDIAKKEIGFITDNYKLSIESLALNNGSFIILITRFKNNFQKKSRVTAKKKSTIASNSSLIYRFQTFDDLLCFTNFVIESFPNFQDMFFKKIILYTYQNNFFIIVDNLPPELSLKLSYTLCEFCNPISDSDLFLYKIKEVGKKISLSSILSNKKTG